MRSNVEPPKAFGAGVKTGGGVERNDGTVEDWDIRIIE
jgi:hypothetical protein